MSKAQHNFFQWILSHAKEKLSKYQFKVSHNLLIKNKFCRWSSSLPDKTVQDEEGWNSTCRPALEGLLIMAQYILVLVLILLLVSVHGWQTKRLLKAFSVVLNLFIIIIFIIWLTIWLSSILSSYHHAGHYFLSRRYVITQKCN